MQKIKLYIFSFVLLFTSVYLNAQEARELDSVVISTSRLGIRKAQSDREIIVIDAQQIRDIPANSLDELMRYIPGLEVQSRGIFGQQADITLRGSTFNQVLVLLDGVRVNDPLTGHFNNIIPIATAEIKRIEIVKGASSAVYGSEAVGGVINIITKSFDKKYGETGSEVDVEAWYGENDLLRLRAGAIIATETWALGVGTDFARSSGYLVEGDSVPGDFNLRTYSVSASLTPNGKLSLKIRSASDIRDFNARYFYTRSTIDLSEENVQRQFNHAQVNYRHSEKQQTVLNAAYQTTRDSFIFNPAFTGNGHISKHLDLNLYHLLNLKGNARMTFGTQYLYKTMSSNDRGDHTHYTLGAYVLGQKTFSNGLNINGGLRLDYDQIFEVELSPQLGASWNLSPTVKLRGYAGRSIRAADFTERFVSTNLTSLSGGRNLGNPDLQAEKSWNTEIGADIYAGNFTFTPTLFYRNASDLIDFILTPAEEIPQNQNLMTGESYFFTKNITNLQTTGLDISVRYRKKIGEIESESYLGLIILNINNPSGDVSKYVANNAGALLNFGTQWVHPKFQVYINGIYKNRTAEEATAINRELVTSYVVINGRVSVTPFSFPLGISLQISNIFDQKYSDILGAQLPGRWIQGGLSYRIR